MAATITPRAVGLFMSGNRPRAQVRWPYGLWPSAAAASMSSGSPAAASPAPPSRLAELVNGMPLVTLVLIFVNVLVYVCDNLGDFSANTATFSISAASVLSQLELWRIVSAAFVHGGIMHIGMNMMSLYQLGAGLVCFFSV